MTDAARESIACMMRCRNEARWIRQSLERTFQVAGTVVLWDDGSDDGTVYEALAAVLPEGTWDFNRALSGSRGPLVVQRRDRCLHVVRSPFRRQVVRPREAVNEIRDRNILWAYCKSSVAFTHMLCLDGDEVLSLAAIRGFPDAIGQLEAGVADVLALPFVYLWDSETTRRVDGIYGAREDGIPWLRFPRLFTVKRVSDADLFDSHFPWGKTPGGFHCGSIPRERLQRAGGMPLRDGFADLPVIHYGYLDQALRQAKFEFYNRLDPANDFEGRYLHIIGEPDQHAPGPVQLVEWHDT